ncbi:MAG: four helix bundle protein [Aureispira sp.]|nr:four helix bundle protein [Aureispira sp.]
MYTYTFERLDVWQKSRTLVKAVYKLSKQFPKEEMFGLTNQVRRAAVSVSSNIAEGNSRFSKKDKARFIEIAYGSLMEILSQLIVAQDLEYIEQHNLDKIKPLIYEINNKLIALRKSLLN